MNTDFWKPFRIGSLFNLLNGKGITAEEIQENVGSLNAVQSGEEHNGVIGRIDRQYCIQQGYTFTDEPCLTVARSGSVGFVSFQPYGCVVGDSAKILQLKDAKYRTPTFLLFFQVLLTANRFKYTYGRKVTEKKYLNEILYLPTNLLGEIDWEWIKQYMKSIDNSISHPRTKNKERNENKDTSLWKFFKISHIFSRLEIGKAQDSFLQDGDDCLYLGAKKSSNGVMRTCKYDPELAHDGNCIVFICNGQGSVGYTNYMDRPFIATTDLVMGYNEHLNPYVGMFLVTVLDLERPKYSFGRKWKTHLADTEIKLPATADGKPDWEYMENYIKSLPYGDCI